MQRFGVGDGFGGGTHIRLGDDFQQGRTGPVQVHAGHALRCAMHRFTGIFFQMGAGDAHHFFVRLGIPRQRLNLYRQCALSDHGQVKLADLIALGQVGVEVIFARKYRARRDVRTHRQAELDGAFHRPFVQHRQHAGQRDADRIRLRVGFSAVSG